MVPGRAPDSHPIDYKDMANVEENFDDAGPQIVHPYGELSAQLGDVYKKKDNDVLIEAMVIAIKGQTIYLGGGLEVPHEELMDTDKWEFQYNPFNS
ncbi:hypothetical protein GCM10020331_008360 [Ectobacillus funiculus]